MLDTLRKLVQKMSGGFGGSGGSGLSGVAGGDLTGNYPNPVVGTVLGGAKPAVLEGSITSYAGNHAVAANEGMLEFTGGGAATFTLPAPSLVAGGAGSAGRQYAFINAGTALLTVAVGGGTLIGDTVIKPGRGAIFITDGANWFQLPFFYPMTRVSRATQTVTNSAALVNDTELAIPLLINKAYIIDLRVVYEAVHGNDIQYTLTVPAGATGGFSPTAVSGNVAVNPSTASTQALRAFGAGGAVSHGGGGAGVPNIISGIAYVQMGATPGSITFQFAQAVAGANNTIRYAGSLLSVVEATG